MSIQLGHMTIGWAIFCIALLHFKIEYLFKDARPEREDHGSAHLQYKQMGTVVLDGLIRTFMSLRSVWATYQVLSQTGLQK